MCRCALNDDGACAIYPGERKTSGGGDGLDAGQMLHAFEKRIEEQALSLRCDVPSRRQRDLDGLEIGCGKPRVDVT